MKFPPTCFIAGTLILTAGGLVAIENIKAGDMVINSIGESLSIEEANVEIVEENITVYNFQVEDYHTYYVGSAGVLVHNADCGKSRGVDDEGGATSSKPNQVHHYATDKSKTYTPQLEEITNKYGLELDDAWNKDLLPHQGRHPNAYHEYILDSMKQFDDIAQGDKDIFNQLFDNLKNNVKSNPDMLYKSYWK